MIWPDEQFRYTKPEPSEPAELSIPALETFTIQPGIDVYLASRPELPTVSLWMSFPTGSISDPLGKKGRSSVCTSLMAQGTERLDKVAFEERQADLASNVWARSGSESISSGLSSLKRTLEPTLELWVEMLRTPGMRQADLDRIKSARRASLRQNKSAPSSLGRRLWSSVVMGAEHPYGRVTTQEDYAAITRRDCRRFVGDLGPQNAQLFVAGAMTRTEVESMIGSRLSWWKGETKVPQVPPAPASSGGGVFFANAPGAAQSQIYVGHPGPSRDASDYESTRLMAAILGGSFSGRVNMNIREDKGYAYGARARFGYYKHGGVFSMTTSVRSDVTEPALRELFKEIQIMRTEPVTADELEREQQAVIASLPAMFSTSSRLLGTYANLVFHGLPLDYYDGFVQRISNVAIADVRSSARDRLQGRGMSVLVVGDAEAVLPGLRAVAREGAFGGRDIVMLDTDGRVVTPNEK